MHWESMPLLKSAFNSLVSQKKRHRCWKAHLVTKSLHKDGADNFQIPLLKNNIVFSHTNLHVSVYSFRFNLVPQNICKFIHIKNALMILCRALQKKDLC